VPVVVVTFEFAWLTTFPLLAIKQVTVFVEKRASPDKVTSFDGRSVNVTLPLGTSAPLRSLISP
jgi:hypothetical protein